MPAKKKSIPLHRLGESTDRGFWIEKVNMGNKAAQDARLMDAHRDDHYIFLLQLAGRSKCMIDFEYFSLQKNTLFFILPGQVHRYLESDRATSGWFVALEVGGVPDQFRAILEDPFLAHQPIQTEPSALKPILQCLQLIYDTSRMEPAIPYSRQMIQGLLTSFVAMVAALYTQRPKSLSESVPRPLAITQLFRKLLSGQYKTLKSPSEYAVALNLSLSYLNEVVKGTTGFAVSHWIQQEIILEAKRLLYFSDCSVKEIAHELGYEDHTYFSRLFKKTALLTPGEFRRRYRE